MDNYYILTAIYSDGKNETKVFIPIWRANDELIDRYMHKKLIGNVDYSDKVCESVVREVVSRNVFELFVTWSNLEDALNGLHGIRTSDLSHDKYEKIRSMRSMLQKECEQVCTMIDVDPIWSWIEDPIYNILDELDEEAYK